jgi:glutathione S-transferase
MTVPLLFTYRRCPYAMRARMALLVSGTAFDGYEVVLRDKPAEMLALSPKGTVPVLRLPDGTVLEQSLDIICWALAPHDPDSWWSRAQSADNLALLAFNDGEFKHQLDRYKYPERSGGSDRDVSRVQAMDLMLFPLEARLRINPYLGGDLPCATDIAVFPFIRQFAAVDSRWFAQQAIPATQTWLARWLDSLLFRACMFRIPSQMAVPFPVFDAKGHSKVMTLVQQCQTPGQSGAP